MSKINFDVPHLCPNCAEPMRVLMPIWITPGSESVDTGSIDYFSDNPKDSNNWFCENCESHHFPVSLFNDDSDGTPTVLADAKITELIRDVKDGDCALSAIFDDGSTRKLFSFFIDELAFFDADLIGKTEGEAHQLHHARTIAYIQS